MGASQFSTTPVVREWRQGGTGNYQVGGEGRHLLPTPPPPPPSTRTPLRQFSASAVAGAAHHHPSPDPGARPPRRDVRARRDICRGPGHACTAPPPPGRHGDALSLRAVGTALHHAMARRRAPSVPRPPAAVTVPDGPSRAAASFPQPPEHVGAADAPLDGTVRPGAGPPPLARPCEPSATPRLPRTERSLASVACALHALGERPPSFLSLEDILMGCFLHWTATGEGPGWGLSAV